MDNLKLPAYPQIDWDQLPSGEIVNKSEGGFNKIELASLIIGAGLCADPNVNSVNIIPEMSVRIATAILEEANK